MQIAIYGKGGIGKSTITSNLSYIYSMMGHSVLQVGCDPKCDSTKLLLGNKHIPSVIESFYEDENQDKNDNIVYESESGVYCCESGGPEPGQGCAGRAIIKTFDIINTQDILQQFDTVVYDVLGDVVCGGFAMPIRMGYADRVVLIVSGEIMSVFAANNIMKTIKKHNELNNVKLAGVIHNSRNVPHEDEIIKKFCSLTGSQLLGKMPRSQLISLCDIRHELFSKIHPEATETTTLVEIAEKLKTDLCSTVPNPLDRVAFDSFVKEVQCFA